eukprot:3981039-Prymnesium_polylepis.1
MLRARPLLRRAFSTAAAPTGRSVAVSPTVEAILRSNYRELDPQAPDMLTRLHTSDAALIWHKHSSFVEHLRGVWLMLVAWEQPQAWCRLGLCHSVYSNSFVSMNLFDPKRDRDLLAELVGDEAEGLIYKFCTIDRQRLEETVLEEATIRAEGYTLRHIHTGAPLEVSGVDAAAM